MFPNLTLSGTWPIAVAIVVGLLLAVLWVSQFAKLMALSDDDFPGQFARFGWVAAFVLLWPLAPFAFISWAKRRPRARKPPRPERGEAD